MPMVTRSDREPPLCIAAPEQRYEAFSRAPHNFSIFRYTNYFISSSGNEGEDQFLLAAAGR